MIVQAIGLKNGNLFSLKQMFKKLARQTALWLIPLHLLTVVFSTGCMSNVTRYRTETVPVEVTEYREEVQTVEKEVKVPYEEKVKTPKYTVTKKPLIPEGAEVKVMGVIPFSTVNGQSASGTDMADRIEQAIVAHPQYSNVYRIISHRRIFESLGKDEEKITREDTNTLISRLNMELLLTGHIKSVRGDILDMNLEVVDLKNEKTIAREILVGTSSKILKQIGTLLFGERVFKGYKVEKVQKTKTERKQVQEFIKKPYKTTKYVDKQVEYEDKVFDVGKTIGNIIVWGLVALLFAQNSSK